jgi:GGDEF domain-containing protein
MMTATLRTQRARSRQAQSGAKRVEVVLDAGQLADLQRIKDRYGYTTADAIAYAISAALVVMARDTPLSS